MGNDEPIKSLKNRNGKVYNTPEARTVIRAAKEVLTIKMDFQSSFFGSVGQMVKKGKELDPMNGIRKAAKEGDWTSMLVEYAANKAGIGGILGGLDGSENQKQGENNPEIAQIRAIPKKINELFK